MAPGWACGLGRTGTQGWSTGPRPHGFCGQLEDEDPNCLIDVGNG